MIRPIKFESGGLQLTGVLGGPEGRSRDRAVVLVHGWSGYRMGPHRILVRTARQLNAAGYYSLHFDLSGRGDSEGDYDATDLDTMIEDTLRAAGTVRRETGCSDVALLGLCSGANVAIGAATLDPGVRNVIAWSALPYQEHVTRKQHQARRRAHLLQYVRKMFRIETWRKILGGRVHYDLVGKALHGSDEVLGGERNLKRSRRDIMKSLETWPGRVLFIHGSKDPEGMAGREVFMKFAEEHNVHAHFRLIEGANHSFYSLAWEREIVGESLSFLEDN